MKLLPLRAVSCILLLSGLSGCSGSSGTDAIQEPRVNSDDVVANNGLPGPNTEVVAVGSDSSGDNVALADDSVDGASVAVAAPAESVEPLSATEAAEPEDLILQEDPLVCAVDFDIAELVFTESDRQWSCSIFSGSNNDGSGVAFDALYFSRMGTVISQNTGVWYWNRILPGDEIRLLSPTMPSMLVRNIVSSNTTLEFNTVSEIGEEAVYECVLVARELAGSSS